MVCICINSKYNEILKKKTNYKPRIKLSSKKGQSAITFKGTRDMSSVDRDMFSECTVRQKPMGSLIPSLVSSSGPKWEMTTNFPVIEK